MESYIEFYYNEDNKLIAEVHKQGRRRVVKNPVNVNKLIEIVNKHGFKVEGPCVIEDKVITITFEFDKYMQKRKKKLQIISSIDFFTNKMKLLHIDPTIRKRVLIGAITLSLGVVGVSSLKDKNTKSSENISYQTNSENVDEQALDEVAFQDTEDNIGIISDNTNTDLDNIFETESFHFSCEVRTNKQGFINSKRYENIFEKYANRYGIDKNLLMALAAQESTGEHYSNLGIGPAEGIMQIEKHIHVGSTVSAYNFETLSVDSIVVTNDNLQNLDSNIQIGTMIFRECLENNNYNIPLALQTYNFGAGNMSKVLSTCSSFENKDIESMTNNPTDNTWLNYRSYLDIGDPEYVEHVFSYLDNNSELSVKDRNNRTISIKIINDYEKANHM